VPSAEDAVKRVNATNMGVLAFFSYMFYKLCGKKQEKQNAKTEKAEETAEIDELINAIE